MARSITLFNTDQNGTFFFCVCVNMILAPLNKLRKKREHEQKRFLKKSNYCIHCACVYETDCLCFVLCISVQF